MGGMTGMIRRIFVGAAAGSLVIVAGSGPVLAGSGSANLAGVTMSYTVPDRVSFDGPGCASIPWTLTWAKPDNRGFDWRLEVRQQGSNSAEDSDSDYQFYWDPGTGSATGTLCAGDYGYDPVRGGMFVGGSVTVEDNQSNTLGTVDFTQALVNIDRNRSRFAKLRVRAGTSYSKPPVVKGKVVADTLTRGTMGADGSLLIEAKYKGKWRKADSSVYPDEFGRFSTTVYSKIPKGIKVRARLSGCGWCTNVKATTQAN